MHLPNIDTLLQTETERIEWKESPRAADALLLAVCALANDLSSSQQPGYLVIGCDKRGRSVGLGSTNLDDEQQKLVSRLQSSRLFPTPSFDVIIANDQGTNLLIVKVEPYPVPPIVMVDSIPYVRKGATTYRASEADVHRLRERRPEHRQPYDLRPLIGTTISDLDTHWLQHRYDSDRDSNRDPDTFPTFQSWLASRSLGRIIDGVFIPSAAAILVHGKSPQDLIPGSVVEFVRYLGNDISTPIVARKTITGTVPDQLEACYQQLAANLVQLPTGQEGIRSYYETEYPIEALRELARNLVQHRMYEGTNAPARIEWYADRIEFMNPGAPFGRASEGVFGSHSDYRNPTLTQLLLEQGYVERLGRGVRIVEIQLQKNNNPTLGVDLNGFTRLTVRKRP